MNIRTIRKPSGFSLVIALAMMILMMVIAVGLLSLAGVATRTESISKAELEAKANARMALMMAIDRLQAELGPDQRISANSAIVSDTATHLHWLGVWDSWTAGPMDDAPVNPSYPSAASHHQTIGSAPDDSMRPDYDNKDAHFRSWLVSLSDDAGSDINSPADLALDARYLPDLNDEAAILVGEGTLGEGVPDEEAVAAGLIAIRQDPSSPVVSGRYSWWVSDQSQKASIMADSYAGTSDLSAASLLQRRQAPASMGNHKIRGIENAEERDFGKLASMKSLDLIGEESAEGVEPSKVNFHTASTYNLGVLADVREGGLKRDLSTLLEREISLGDHSDEFMLYKFNGANEQVPIQDLSAFYQLYKDDESWAEGGRSGIKYNSDQANLLRDAIQVEIPDYAHASGREKYLREYSSMYRSPVPIKVQFVMAVGAVEITPEEREYIRAQAEISAAANSPGELSGFRKPVRDTDTHKLRLGIMPVVSMWNPTNVPLVMDKQMIFKAGCPPFAYRWKKYRDGEDPNRPYRSPYFNLNGSMSPTLSDGRVDINTPNIIQMQIPGKEPVVFGPGEVILFSVDPEALDDDLKLIEGGAGASSYVKAVHAARTGADLDGFIVCPNAATARVNRPRGSVPYPLNQSSHMGAHHQPDIYNFGSNSPFPAQGFMVFNPNDTITIEAVQESRQHQRIHNSVGKDNFGFNISHSAETHGSAFSFYMYDERHEGRNFLRQSQLLSRFCSDGFWVEPELTDFNGQLMLQGMPGNTQIFSANATDSILGSQIINATRDKDVVGMLEFTMNAACESSEFSVGGYAGGRKAATRPFLHSQIISPPFIDHHGKAAMYNYGWDWQLTKINSLDESIVGGKPGTRNDYYGGGYTIEAGVTHVVQQHLPVIPPMAIAELSHAHLGGYSLANNAVVGNGSSDNIDSSDWHQFASRRKGQDLKWPAADGFRRTTAVGFGGLAPSIVQAIGNSYAHPNIPADKAFKQWDRVYDQDIGTEQKTFADHSYLANKALWDDCFFSSITPKPDVAEIWETRDLTAAQTAEDFLYHGMPLPNRRFIPYVNQLAQDEFADFASSYDDYTGGFSDRISGLMMVNGPFNVNSTSVEAWKIFLSSLHNKTTPYYRDESGYQVRESTPIEGVAVSAGSLANGEPIASRDISSDPNQPADQWTRARLLSDEEIEELSIAIVEQVKQRGPFLSLSEFINRRLDGNDAELALKGALQAALDDDSVSINEAFRDNSRSLSPEAARVIDGSDATNGGEVEFEEALEGPIAYGSTPYVDQADLLRSMGAVLTPRGDTFVIRTYGDSLDASGRVKARAWCEAVVQRVPDYVDGRDEPHLKQSELPATSPSRFMGRKFEIVSFRWLHASEI